MVSAAPLELWVDIHIRNLVTATSNVIGYTGSPHRLVVRMHRNTPFKSLIDKLSEKYGHLELRLKGSPLERIFDSDTPASVSKPQQVFALPS